MKREGLLHERLAGVVAALGHGQLLTVADAGLPIAAGVERIDLSVTCGTPSFSAVLTAIAAELVVERVVVATESAQVPGAPLEAALASAFGEGQPPREIVDHGRLKELAASSAAVVRTGECTPYMNVVLVAGVSF